jgi:hypothetical protein
MREAAQRYGFAHGVEGRPLPDRARDLVEPGEEVEESPDGTLHVIGWECGSFPMWLWGSYCRGWRRGRKALNAHLDSALRTAD